MVRHGYGSFGHLADAVRVLVAEREPDPGTDEVAVVRGHQRVVRRAALGDPTLGGERVEIADDLGLLDRVAGVLDPDVGPPDGARLRRAEQVADRAPAARERDRARRIWLLQDGCDLVLARVDRLVRRGRSGSAARCARCRAANSSAAASMCSAANGRTSSRMGGRSPAELVRRNGFDGRAGDAPPIPDVARIRPYAAGGES